MKTACASSLLAPVKFLPIRGCDDRPIIATIYIPYYFRDYIYTDHINFVRKNQGRKQNKQTRLAFMQSTDVWCAIQ